MDHAAYAARLLKKQAFLQNIVLFVLSVVEDCGTEGQLKDFGFFSFETKQGSEGSQVTVQMHHQVILDVSWKSLVFNAQDESTEVRKYPDARWEVELHKLQRTWPSIARKEMIKAQNAAERAAAEERIRRKRLIDLAAREDAKRQRKMHEDRLVQIGRQFGM